MLINPNEIMETIQMVRMEHLDNLPQILLEES